MCYVHQKTCVRVLTAALFIIAENCEQPTCSLIAEWTDCNVHTMEYHAGLKGNTAAGSAEESHNSVEKKKAQDSICCMIILYEAQQPAKLIYGDRNQSSSCLCAGEY